MLPSRSLAGSSLLFSCHQWRQLLLHSLPGVGWPLLSIVFRHVIMKSLRIVVVVRPIHRGTGLYKLAPSLKNCMRGNPAVSALRPYRHDDCPFPCACSQVMLCSSVVCCRKSCAVSSWGWSLNHSCSRLCNYLHLALPSVCQSRSHCYFRIVLSLLGCR